TLSSRSNFVRPSNLSWLYHAPSTPWPLPAQPDKVARSASVLFPRRKTRKLVGAQRLAGIPDLVPHGGQKGIIYGLTSSLTIFVEVQHLDQVGAFTGELLISNGVDVKLITRDILGLGTVSGLEVDDRHLAGVQSANKVDAAVDSDTRRDVDLDLFF